MDGLKYKKNEKGLYVPQIDEATDNNGLVQRSNINLMDKIQPLKKTKQVSLNISFLQIYNEKIYDLLNPGMFKRIKGDGLMQPAFHHAGASGQVDPAGLKLKWNPFDVYTVENLFTFQCTGA